MKLARPIFASLLLLPGALAAQEGIATYKYVVHAQAAVPGGESRVYFSPTAVRVEMQMSLTGATERSRQAPAGMPSVFKTTTLQKASEPNKIYTLNDERHTYSVTDVTRARAESSSARPDEKYTVQRGGSDRVAGVACQKAQITSSSGNEIEVCMATDLASAMPWWSMMSRQSARQVDWVKAMQESGLKGFPVRMKFHSAKGSENGPSEIEMELTKLERTSVPASMFQVPAGYRETGPQTVNMTPAQEKQMNDALSNLTPEQRKAYEDAMKAREGKKQ